jgi:hypothetical protein
MKKSILFIAVILFSSLFLEAQATPKNRKVVEKVKSLKVGYITNALELTPEESQKFWPLYNQYEAEKMTLLKENVVDKSAMQSDAEAATFLSKYFEVREKEIAIEKKYAEKFKSSIGVRKVARLFQVEKKFRQEIMSKIAERRKDKG